MPTKNKKRIQARNGKCLTCPNKAQSRGLCWKCYQNAQGKMNRGEAPESQLIEMGLMLKAKRPGRPKDSMFSKAFKARKK